jgi:hypothetical protein
MLPLIIILVVGFVIYKIRRQHKQQLLVSWQLAASSLPGFRCIPGGAISGYPSLTGMIEGRRIDVAPFFHQEFGNNNTQMTGYRVRCDAPIELPGEAVTSLTNHFQKFEVDDRRIFCATYGVEHSSSSLVTKIRKIEAAIQLAEQERDRQAAELLAKSRAEIDAVQLAKQVEENAQKNLEPTTQDKENETTVVAEISTPPPLPDADELSAGPVLLPTEVTEKDIAEVDANGPQPEPQPEPESFDAVPVPRAPASNDTLTRAALDLFASGHNKFEITRLFDGEYKQREIDGKGILQRVDTYANDRTFGRGPGVVAEIEVSIPEAPATDGDEEGHDIPAYHREPRPNAVRLRVALPPVEDVSVGSQARELRQHIGDEVELLGTLCRCDPFDTSLHLCGGVIG